MRGPIPSALGPTHKHHGPWVPGTHKEVNHFESLELSYTVNTMAADDLMIQGAREQTYTVEPL